MAFWLDPLQQALQHSVVKSNLRKIAIKVHKKIVKFGQEQATKSPLSVQWHTILLDRWCPMEYKRGVQTIVETPTYLAIANKLFSEEERADIVTLVAADPECGNVIRGTGGFRKVRVARKGMGKSGGARVVYIWRNERFPVFLITVFPKNDKENLSMAERNALKQRADGIFETYGR
jgi:hypothetical protein